LFAAECVVSLALGRGNTSHHERGEILGLGSLLLWAPLLAAYFNAFEWRPETRRWRNACFIWWAMLVITAWAMFLPGLLDRVKFTNALVGHAHMAMAGFVSSLDIYLLVALLGERGRGFNSRWAFFAWNAGAFSYTGLMFLAGWLEAIDPSFAFVPGASRDAIYSLRLVCGGVMAAAAVHWWRELSRSMAERLPVAREETPAEAIASGFAAVESR